MKLRTIEVTGFILLCEVDQYTVGATVNGSGQRPVVNRSWLPDLWLPDLWLPDS